MAELTPEHRAFLLRQGVDPDFALTLGICSVLTVADLEDDWRQGIGRFLPDHPGILFPWVSPDGERTAAQLRPDDDRRPADSKTGEPMRYVFQKGRPPVLWPTRQVEHPIGIILAEGSKQSVVAAQYAPEGWAVYGVAGCYGWSDDGVPVPDLAVTDGLPVKVILDADIATNPDVWTAGNRLKAALRAEGAELIEWVKLPAGGKSGLDDYLAKRPAERRARVLGLLLSEADAKFPAKPSAKARKTATPSGPPHSDDGRALVVTSRDRREVINELSKALAARFSGVKLFNHGGVISQYETGTMIPLDRGTFNDVAVDAALMVSEDGDGNYTPGWADENSMKAVLSRAKEYAPLDQIRRCPFVRADGTICQEPGYDEASRTILSEVGGLAGLDIPEGPTAADLQAAREFLLTEWLGDMPFPDAASRANALALALTPFVRGHFDQVPLAVIDGLQMGVGKNLLADCIAIVVTGERTQPINFVDDEAEQRKQITSAFRTGSEMFVFDEAHTVSGRAFAQALTAATWQDRILGVSTMAQFPNRVTWLSLGNQVKVMGDLNRRVYRIALWPTYRDPMNRAAHLFRHPGVSGLGLEDWTRANRVALVRAALILVRAWFSAGQPSPSRNLTFGSFNGWERVVGGIIEHAGVPGFLDNLSSWREEADEGAQFVISHLGWLFETFGTSEFRTADVKNKALTDPAGYQALLGLEDATRREFTVELGKAYGRMKERIQGGFKLTKRGGHAKTVLWTVAREVSEVSEGYPPTFTHAKNTSLEVSNGIATPEEPRVYGGQTAGGHPSHTSDTSTVPADSPIASDPPPPRCPNEADHEADWACGTCEWVGS